MVRHTRHHDGQGGRRLGGLLRREAHGARPEFSTEFQARLIRRIEPLSRPEAAAEVRPAPAAARTSGVAAWRQSWPLAAAVLMVAAVGLGVVSREGPPPGPPSEPAAAEVASRQPPNDEELPGIEALPTFDDLEEGLRAGVRTLAASLVDVPDWASLANFDATSLLGGPEGP